MRIGLDALAVGESEGTGLQSYSFNLVRSLLSIDESNEFIVYCRRRVPEVLRPFARKAEFRVCRLGSRKLCEQGWMPFAVPRDGLDVFHGLAGLPLRAPHPAVLTVHGLSWRIIPEVFSALQRAYWRYVVESGIHRAARLVCISEWTKNVVVDRIGIPADRIDVVHHGLNHEFFRPITDETLLLRVREHLDLPERFVLFVSALLPVKNVSTLVCAYDQLIRRKEMSDVGLVIAGGRGWGSEAPGSLWRFDVGHSSGAGRRLQ